MFNFFGAKNHEHSLVVKIRGGLGNQLFQYAFYRSLSEKFDNVFIDNSFFLKQFKRNFQLNKFPYIKYKVNNKKNRDAIICRDNPDFTYTPIPEIIDTSLIFDGYWQSEKYFQDYASLIKSELKPNTLISEKLNRIVQSGMINVSIHIRRTDYVSQPDKHPLQPIEYYADAISSLGKYDKLFVFSDDINWCKKNLSFAKMHFVDSLSDIESFWLMSMCTHNIIANSSFSWWAAWLNDNDNKTIIAPKNWFGKAMPNKTNDLIPETWLQI